MAQPIPWKIRHSHYLHTDRWIRLRADSCETANGTIIEPYYVLEYPDYAAALAITEDQEAVLINIYRHGLRQTLLELPGGCIDKQEDPAETVRRELLEETGYEFQTVEKVTEISPNPSMHNNLMHGFLATGGRKVAEPQPEAGESLEVVLLPLAELKEKLFQNEIVQSMHVSILFYALRQMGEL